MEALIDANVNVDGPCAICGFLLSYRLMGDHAEVREAVDEELHGQRH
jgi:hypothetical protein